MKRVLTVPPTLDDEAFDGLVRDAAASGGDGDEQGFIVNARNVDFANPYGMIGLLALGQHLGATHRTRLELPDSPDVLSYMGRMGFFHQAAGIFDGTVEPRGRRPDGPSSVLLEITPVRSHEDIHTVIDEVNERAGTILSQRLGYSRAESVMFSAVLSEVCQNIVEHAEVGGWVGIQTYNWARRLGRQVVVIAVMDLGVGFRGSLAREHSARFGEKWDDATALEAAFTQGTTRFRDPGRGQGIKQIRKNVGRWGGKVSIRSGTAKVAQIPDWDDDLPLERNLPHFPGSQILIVIPAKIS